MAPKKSKQPTPANLKDGERLFIALRKYNYLTIFQNRYVTPNRLAVTYKTFQNAWDPLPLATKTVYQNMAQNVNVPPLPLRFPRTGLNQHEIQLERQAMQLTTSLAAQIRINTEIEFKDENLARTTTNLTVEKLFTTRHRRRWFQERWPGRAGKVITVFKSGKRLTFA